jgi:hypothetical protein
MAHNDIRKKQRKVPRCVKDCNCGGKGYGMKDACDGRKGFEKDKR